jgi:outer membrane protein OmpA-like peptidoglycan-associated protein
MALPGAPALAVILAAILAVFSWAPVRAADTPSASQIINDLTPGHGGAMTTRGIRLGGPPPAGTKPATATSTGGGGGGGMARPAESNLSVPFTTGSAAISPAAARVLDQLGEALSSPKLAEFKFRVEGHTDTVGQPEMNKTLSEQRAASVVEYLTTRHSIDRARLTPVGMGVEGLLVDTGPDVPSAANRRVLVVNLGH